jgi:hypothetical protein
MLAAARFGFGRKLHLPDGLPPGDGAWDDSG